MSEQWYYGKNGQQLGPVTEDELRNLANSGQLAPHDQVWKAGMANWVSAGSVGGLFPAGASPSPTNAPASSPGYQPAPSRAPAGEQRGRRDDGDDYERRPRRRGSRREPKKSGSGLLIGLLVGGGVFLLLICGGIVGLIWYIAANAASFGPPPPSPIVAGAFFDLNRTGTIRRGDENRHTVFLRRNNTYTIDLQSHGMDNFLILRDPSGRQLSSNDNGGSGRNARITYTPSTSATYTIIAKGSNRNEQGRYRLTVYHRNVGGVPTRTDKDVSARLAPGGKLSYTLFLSSTRTYHIDLMSSEFDTFLFLYNTNNQLIRSDDDGGIGLNSRIVYRPTRSGNYRITVGSFGGRDGGRFRLTVRH